MRFLIVSEYLPRPTDQHGVFQRLGTFAKALDRLGCLNFLFFVGPRWNVTPEDTAELITDHWGIRKPRVFIEQYGAEPGASRLVADYLSPMTSIHRQAPYARMSGADQVAVVDRHLATHPDMVFAHRLGAMSALLLTRQPAPPILFDLDDIEHKAAARSISKPPNWRLKRLRYLHLPALWFGERAAIHKAHTAFVCSVKDREYLRRTMRTGSIKVLPNTSAPPSAIPPSSSAPPNILFLGSYDYRPNTLAAEILIRDIWPRVTEQAPWARLLIAGANPHNISAYGEPQTTIEFTGFVDDLHALYARSRVICTPIQNGGGTRIKIIEAAMHARPVVSTSIGAEGLEFVSEKEILISDNAEGLAALCIDLLQDPVRCDELGEAAKQSAIRHYGREAAIKKIIGVANRALDGTTIVE